MLQVSIDIVLQAEVRQDEVRLMTLKDHVVAPRFTAGC